MSSYEFRVAVHLDAHWSSWLCDLTLDHHSDGTSTLTGPIADQSQLYGVLTHLRDMGATLLSVQALPDEPAGAAADGHTDRPSSGC